MTISLTPRILALIRRFSRLPARATYAWGERAIRHSGLGMMMLPNRRCARIIVLSKWHALPPQVLIHLPPDVGILADVPLFNANWQALIRHISSRTGAEVAYAGDLDPLDLISYLELCRILQPVVSVRYCGVSDAWKWLEHAHAETAVSLVCQMHREERRWSRVLLQTVPAVAKLVGHRCAQLLQSGYKLELEGAVNPKVHGSHVISGLRRSLFGG